MIKVALSHDIDRVSKSYQYFTKTVSALMKANFNGISKQILSLKEKKPYWTFDKFIEIEESYQIRSTVFFLNESIKWNPLSINSFKLAKGRYKIEDPKITEMIKFLDKNGWEIGLHGSYLSYKNQQLLEYEKRTIENIIGHPVIGIRQHYLNLSDSTWEIQSNLGFKYDSSFGYTNDIGFKSNKILPFKVNKGKLLEIPLVIMDTCFMQKKNKWDLYTELLDVCEEKNAVMVINFHQHVFSKYDFPDFDQAYIQLIEMALKRGAKFFTLSEIYEMYKK
jgi:peptidoglycan/xylan/chitin deacetylase (PgdA/CDA1 family)